MCACGGGGWGGVGGRGGEGGGGGSLCKSRWGAIVGYVLGS